MIIRAGALGDTLMLLPAIAQLRAKAGVILSGRYPGIDFLRPYVDQCMDFEGSGWHRLFIKGAARDHGIYLPGVDHVVAFLSDEGGNVMQNLSDCLPDARIHIFPAFPPENENVHIALYMARSLQEAGLPLNARHSLDHSYRQPLMAGHGQPKRERSIVLHPGSGSIKKNYPPDLWVELIRVFQTIYPDGGQRIILLLGPAEEGSRSFFSGRLDGMATELIFCPEKDKLLSILSRALLYIGHDSGITHMAAMLGTPVIALFKGSSVRRWAPLGPAVRIIKDKKGGSNLIKDIAHEGMKFIVPKS
ncbi:glycosyltransferase family 9 protein [Thermodesulfobacteriota bacterium]